MSRNGQVSILAIPRLGFVRQTFRAVARHRLEFSPHPRARLPRMAVRLVGTFHFITDSIKSANARAFALARRPVGKTAHRLISGSVQS